MELKEYIKNYLAGLNISEERSIILAEQYGFILPILNKKIFEIKKIAEKYNIELDVLLWGLITSLKCAQSEEEGKSIGTGILIGDVNEIIKFLTEDVIITLPDNLNIKNWEHIRKYCGNVNGINSIFVVNKNNGIIVGAKMLPRNMPYKEAYSIITGKILKSLAICILGINDTLNIYYDGKPCYQLMRLRKFGRWILRDYDEVYKLLDERKLLKRINKPARKKLTETILDLSEIGKYSKGSAVIIGDCNELEKLITSKNEVRRVKNITDISKEELIRHATSGDGHTIFDTEGNLRYINAIFRAEGGRKASVKDVSEKTSSLGIAISQDAEITIFDKGEIIKEF